jgi:hypothetical protein
MITRIIIAIVLGFIISSILKWILSKFFPNTCGKKVVSQHPKLKQMGIKMARKIVDEQGITAEELYNDKN